MLIKFETKSCRVMGLSFHADRPWILASLHNGKIQLWDYQLGHLMFTFEGHTGPVRGIHFHRYRDLFVSGGDDMHIKVWNYKNRQCSFTLRGHTDCIHTVQFHHESPWIVSASDDYTIQIWNFQSRTCVSVLYGHKNSVMSASFHTKDDLMVSASLDKTVRVWDISALREKAPALLPQDTFQGPEATTKFLLKGHTEGVNWACFHPNSPIIVSASDDQLVKLWRMSALCIHVYLKKQIQDAATLTQWRVTQIMSLLRLFLTPNNILIVSSSEDKTICFYDMMTRGIVETYRRENDRFWVLTNEPSSNLLAAGHDSGLIIFKKERERPCFFHCLVTNTLFALKDSLLHIYNLKEEKEARLATLSRPCLIPDEKEYPVTLSYSPTDASILVSYNTEESSFELYYIKDMLVESSIGMTKEYNLTVSRFRRVEGVEGTGTSVVSVTQNRVAVLDRKSNQVILKNLQNKDIEKGTLPIVSNSIFYAGMGKVLCKSDDCVAIYDLQQMATICQMPAMSVKYVSWSNNMESVALISKHTVCIASKDLAPLCMIHEKVNLKSGAWDENGAFIYNTLSHIKYCLVNGENGIIQTQGLPGYITGVAEGKIYFLDRAMRVHIMTINNSEYLLKLHLHNMNYKKVVDIIKKCHFPGQAMVSYLADKGFPELALQLAKDEKTRFNLALESGNMEEAIASAELINEKDCWHKLGGQVLKQGYTSIAKYAYQQAKNSTMLSSLYLVTGSIGKLSVMGKIAETENNFIAQFHNALVLGNVIERVKILENSDQLMLAYVTARTHGLTEMANKLVAKLGENVPVITRPKNRYGSLLVPPAPIISGGNWPLLKISGVFDGEFDKLLRELEVKHGKEEQVASAEPGIPGGLEGPENEKNEDADTEVIPGQPVTRKWTEKSLAPGEHAAAGNVVMGVMMLQRQIGVSNFTPLKPLLINTYVGSHAYLGTNASSPVLDIPIVCMGGYNPPKLAYNLHRLKNNLESAYQSFTCGRHDEALKCFLTILHTAPFIVVDSKKEALELKALVRTAREYTLGLKMELKRNELKDDNIHKLHLAVYITNCKLQKEHCRIVLHNAMIACYTNRNYMTASHFARLLLDNGATDQQLNNARKVIQFQANGEKGDDVPLEYDHRNSFVVCGSSFRPIRVDQGTVVCPHCGAHFQLELTGTICGVCEIATVGANVSGHMCLRTSSIERVSERGRG